MMTIALPGARSNRRKVNASTTRCSPKCRRSLRHAAAVGQGIRENEGTAPFHYRDPPALARQGAVRRNKHCPPILQVMVLSSAARLTSTTAESKARRHHCCKLATASRQGPDWQDISTTSDIEEEPAAAHHASGSPRTRNEAPAKTTLRSSTSPRSNCRSPNSQTKM